MTSSGRLNSRLGICAYGESVRLNWSLAKAETVARAAAAQRVLALDKRFLARPVSHSGSRFARCRQALRSSLNVHDARLSRSDA